MKEEITPVEEKPVEQNPPQEKPEEEKTKKESVPEVSVEVPTVEIIVEDEKVQEENSKNREISECDSESDPSSKLKYTYKEGIHIYTIFYGTIICYFTFVLPKLIFLSNCIAQFKDPEIFHLISVIFISLKS